MTRTLHRLLRLLLPRTFRARHGRAMEDVFADAREEAGKRGAAAVLALWLREAADLARTGRRLRREGAARKASVPPDPRRGRGTAARAGLTFRAGRSGMVDDLRMAIRALRRRPSTTVFAVLTVALGVGSTTAIFGALEGVVLNPLPYEGGERVVQLWRRMDGLSVRVSPTRDQADALAAQKDVVEAVAPWSISYWTLTGHGEARPFSLGLIRPGFHDMVGRPPLLGRTFSDEELAGEGARVLLLGHGLWQQTFGGDRRVLGRALTLDGEPWTIIGVMPPRTVLPGWGVLQVDAWGPLSDARFAEGTNVAAMLRTGATAETLTERLAAAAPNPDGTWEDAYGNAWRAEARLMRDLLSASLVNTLTVLMAAVALLLVIACVNVANLLLSSASARRRETAVRSALGAGRLRLVRQFLAESVMIAVLGGLLGVAIAWGGHRLMISLRPESLSALDAVAMNVRVLVFALVLTAASGLAFGLVPALRASRLAALEPLRAGARGGTDPVAGRFRWGLVTVQVALSFSLLAGALLVLGTLGRLSRSDAGFDAEHVLVLDLELPRWKLEAAEERGALYEDLVARLRDLPGVDRVAQSGGAPTSAGVWFGPMWAEGAERPDESFLMHGTSPGTDYFGTIGQRILAGRGFNEEEIRLEHQVIVLGETAARRFFGETDPVGRTFLIGEGAAPHTVVGVVADVAMTGLGAAEADLQGYQPLPPGRGRTLLIRFSDAADARGLLSLVRDQALATADDVVLNDLSLASDLLQSTLDRERFALSAIGAFALMALVLAAVGLYGLLAQVVGGRVREIGVRMALGASRASVQALVLRTAAIATVSGIAAGTGLAVVGVTLLESQLFGVDGERPGAYALAAVVLAGTALLAAYVPARRAARVDPVSAMRAE